MRISRSPSTNPTEDEQEVFDRAIAYEVECERAYHAARAARPFDKAAEVVAFEKYRKAIEASNQIARGDR
jgi:hypothetical protein